MADKKIIVFIYLPGETIAVPAGIFTHDAIAGVGSFAYGRKYASRENALAVDPAALPLGAAPREATTNKGIYGAFRDASPDYWGRLVIATEKKVPPEALTEIDFLLDASATRVGNLDFRTSPDAPEPSPEPPHFHQMADILNTASRIASGQEAAPHFLRLLRQGSSMGGARPKCTVLWRDALWIAKFPSRDDSLNIPRIEYATLRLAEKCGIHVPETRLESIDNNDILLVRRFDRDRHETGWTRTGFLSALSLMEWDESDRLRWDYASIADAMRRNTSLSDVHELFRRMVFNILIRNTDDHPRNHGFLFDGSSLRLSPAYDLTPAPAMPGVSSDFFLAMNVGEQGREATPENAVSRATRFGLSEDAAWSVIMDMMKTVQDWPDHFSALGCPNEEINALAPSFARCRGERPV
ncbi:MAG: HipA domain-containing protein [Desulfosalsimonadaceae bacterium]